MNARECEITCHRVNYRGNERALHTSWNKLVIEFASNERNWRLNNPQTGIQEDCCEFTLVN